MPLARRFNWKAWAALVALTAIVVLQRTRQAMLPRKQTPLLWAAEVLVIAGVLLLHSNWARGGPTDEQSDLGTLANNFYEPRREALTNGFAIGCGVFCSVLWALATWSVVLGGMRRGVMGRGLLDFETAALAGAITGGVIGAVIGRGVGHAWEMRHRRRRLAGAGRGAG